jgi:hypothetical protein
MKTRIKFILLFSIANIAATAGLFIALSPLAKGSVPKMEGWVAIIASTYALAIAVMGYGAIISLRRKFGAEPEELERMAGYLANGSLGIAGLIADEGEGAAFSLVEASKKFGSTIRLAQNVSNETREACRRLALSESLATSDQEASAARAAGLERILALATGLLEETRSYSFPPPSETKTKELPQDGSSAKPRTKAPSKGHRPTLVLLHPNKKTPAKAPSLGLGLRGLRLITNYGETGN